MKHRITTNSPIRTGHSHQNGFAMLLLVIIVGVVSFSYALLLTEHALEENSTSRARQSYLTARYATEACLEGALLSIRNSANFTGIHTQTVADILCTSEVIDRGGEKREVRVTATKDGYTSNMIATVTTRSPQVTATWIDAQSF